MKISKERFEELVSVYLDGEASEDELNLLASCIRGNRRMYDMFFRACRVHMAMCKMYGKEAKFSELSRVDLSPISGGRKISKRRIAAEWATVAALMTLSFTLFIFAIIPPSASTHMNSAYGSDESVPVANAQNTGIDTEESFDISIVSSAQLSDDGSILSVLKMSPKHRSH